MSDFHFLKINPELETHMSIHPLRFVFLLFVKKCEII